MVFQLQLAHRLDALPLTRDYLAAAETALEKGAEREPAEPPAERAKSIAAK